jgi:Tfp pilus assembly protein PilV
MSTREWRVASGEWRARRGGSGTPHSALRTPHASGLTLVEVLMSLMVTGIGLLGVIALLPLAFVRAVQATNLTNGTILRYNAEGLLTPDPRFLLRWQPNWAYQAGDIVLVPAVTPPVQFACTTAGTSGSYPLPTASWNGTVGQTTTDNTVVWTAQANPPARYVIDPIGWNALGATLQGALGNNGAATPAPDPNAILRYNGEVTSAVAAVLQASLPDSWTELARAPLSPAATTTTSVTLMNVDLSAMQYTAVPQTLAAATPPYTISRVVLIDATGKFSQTRIITGFTAPATISWSANDPLTGGFTPASARVETREGRYSWLLTVIPSTSTIFANIEVTVFFNRAPTSLDEQVFQEQTPNADGVTTPFHFAYTPGKKPFVKKGSFLFDCYYGRWYRVVNVLNDTGSAFDIIVDQPRQQADMLLGTTFGAVFMRGVVDVFPITPQ